MRNPYLFLIVFTSLILAIDFYAYRGIKKLSVNYGKLIKRIVFILFWIIPLILILGIILFGSINRSIDPAKFLTYFHFISGTFVLFYVPKLVFVIFNFFDDLVLLFKKLFTKKKVDLAEPDPNRTPITRGQFLNRVGIVMAGLPFLSIAYGIKWGRFNYTIRNHTLRFANLPKSFDGLRVVQISDFHLGSFLNKKEEVEEAVEFINEQEPDLLLFTGDFVNNVSSEIDLFMPALKKLKAKYGMYSIFGNHDYGDYVKWETPEKRQENIDRIIKLQEEAGFEILLNDSTKIELNGESINLVGVENWGLPPFPQYGDLNKALANVEKDSFKILMSHDPTHWDEQILEQTNIDLTLSGHTHGAQFGVEIPGWRWSPVSMRYKRWGGIYEEGKQYLNVNTGIGFIGFPGRVGMPPEISVIELRRSAGSGTV
ncbi:MAG: metallophosphoesterase [Ignavibacteriae bacterium]|nr:metallophosphoesterase [Ignavibacteriota bacterium]NOG99484.1 metallophosphoesterase [Ignavibacteriota bacterium]